MRISNLIVLLVLYLFAYSLEAKVRELSVTSSEMGRIYLKMGKSTVLRFNEKPKKVVIGNQNYFNVEFIENDVTIQPLGKATTNLFIYGEFQTYGLLLSVIDQDYYDDLVMVKRSFGNFQPPKPSKKKTTKTPKLLIEEKLGNRLAIKIDKVFYHDFLKTYILDLKLKNTGENEVLTKEISVNLTRGKQRIGGQKIIYDKEQIGMGEEIRSRIFFQSEAKSLTMGIKLGSDEWNQIIDGKFL